MVELSSHFIKFLSYLQKKLRKIPNFPLQNNIENLQQFVLFLIIIVYD